jgi:hypothetical protein
VLNPEKNIKNMVLAALSSLFKGKVNIKIEGTIKTGFFIFTKRVPISYNDKIVITNKF